MVNDFFIFHDSAVTRIPAITDLAFFKSVADLRKQSVKRRTLADRDIINLILGILVSQRGAQIGLNHIGDIPKVLGR